MHDHNHDPEEKKPEPADDAEEKPIGHGPVPYRVGVDTFTQEKEGAS